MAAEIAPRIVVDRNVRFGKPIIRGTRVTVETVIGHLAGGMSLEEVAGEYDLGLEDIRAALRYAADRVATAEISRRALR